MRNRERRKKYPGCWLENSVFYCRYTHPVTGKDTTAKFGRETVDRTWAKCRNYREKLMQGEVKPPQEIRAEERKTEGLTIAALAERYFDHNDNRNKSIHSTDKLTLAGHLVPYFGSADITKLTKKDLIGFREYLDKAKQKNGQPYSDQSKKHFMGLLQRVLNYNDILFSSVFWKQVTPVVRKRRNKKGYLTEEEMADLRRTLDTYPHNPQVVRMMRLMMTYGCRCSELTRLRWKNVDFKARTIRLTERKNGAPDLLLGMDDEVMATLKEQRGKVLPMPELIVFPAEDGGVRITQAVSRACRKILDKAGIDKTFKPTHGFRDNTAFYLNKEADLDTASKYLGHTSTRTTQNYIETIEDGHVAAVSIMTAIKARG